MVLQAVPSVPPLAVIPSLVPSKALSLSSVSGLVSKLRYRSPLDQCQYQSQQSISKTSADRHAKNPTGLRFLSKQTFDFEGTFLRHYARTRLI